MEDKVTKFILVYGLTAHSYGWLVLDPDLAEDVMRQTFEESIKRVSRSAALMKWTKETQPSVTHFLPNTPSKSSALFSAFSCCRQSIARPAKTAVPHFWIQ